MSGFKPYRFNTKNVSRYYQGSVPTVTFKQNGEGLFLSSGFVDKYELKPAFIYKVFIDIDTKRIRLERTHNIDTEDAQIVRTAKAGGVTKAGNDRLLIRMREILHSLNIIPSQPITVLPVVANNGDIITFSYKECINVRRTISSIPTGFQCSISDTPSP